MSSVQEIQEAIRQLSINDRATLSAWFAECDAADWDRQFEALNGPPLTRHQESYVWVDRNVVAMADIDAVKEAFQPDLVKIVLQKTEAAMEKAGKLKRIPFADRAQMKKMVDPVMAEYAKEIGADGIYAKINAIQ